MANNDEFCSDFPGFIYKTDETGRLMEFVSHECADRFVDDWG